MRKISLTLVICGVLFADTAQLGTIEVSGEKHSQNPQVGAYSSGTTYDKKNIKATPAQNYTIDSVLRQNPNVIFDASGEYSTSSGEINPKNFSINGASFYQNNFTVDGANFTNDLDPAGYPNVHHNIWRSSTLGSQAANLDIDMFESIEVMDSGVSAKYGGFLGGVVDAKTRDPRPGFHGIMSLSHTNSSWNKTFIDELVADRYKNTRGWFNNGNFTKWRYRIGFEGMINENFGLILDYTRHTSNIKSHTKPSMMNDKFYSFPDQKRMAENLFIKGLIKAGDRLVLRPTFIYAPQTNSYFIESALDSNMQMKFGGYITSLEAVLDLDDLLITQTLSLGMFDSSRYSDEDVQYAYAYSNLKDWGTKKDGSTYGALGDMEMKQNNLSYKLDLESKEIKSGDLSHKLRGGLELSHQDGSYKISKPFASYNRPGALPDGYICKTGDKTCVNDDSFDGKGQYFKRFQRYGDVDNKANLDKIAIYIEDEMSYGRFKIRPGVRFEKDSFSKDLNIAPRFVTEYDLFGDDTNFIGFGLNRYYGRNFFTYKIYNDMYANYVTYLRNHPDEEFVRVGNWQNDTIFRGLKNPYDDELSLFYRGDIGNTRLALKYIKRNSKNEIVMLSKDELSLESIKDERLEENYIFYANDGKSKTDIVSFSAYTINPLEFYGSLNNLGVALTYMDKTSDFKGYRDQNRDRKVLYEGDEIRFKDLPVISYYTPFSAKFMHSINFPSLNLTFSNFLTFTSNTKALIQEYDNDKKMTSFKKVKLPNHMLWDITLQYDQKIKSDVDFFTKFTVNNILNKKYTLDAGLIDGQVYRSFGQGRSFMIEAGIKW